MKFALAALVLALLACFPASTPALAGYCACGENPPCRPIDQEPPGCFGETALEASAAKAFLASLDLPARPSPEQHQCYTQIGHGCAQGFHEAGCSVWPGHYGAEGCSCCN